MAEVPTDNIEQIFCSALEIQSSVKRSIFLGILYQGNAGLRARVHELLVLEPDAERFFQELVVDLKSGANTH